MTLVKMRTVKECVNEIKLLDPMSAITEWYIRTLCAENTIKHFKSGKKILVNLDDLIAYINFEKCEV